MNAMFKRNQQGQINIIAGAVVMFDREEAVDSAG